MRFCACLTGLYYFGSWLLVTSSNTHTRPKVSMQSILSFLHFPKSKPIPGKLNKNLHTYMYVQRICMLMLCVFFFRWHQRIFRVDFVVAVVDMGMIILSKSILLIITFVSDASMMRKYDCQKKYRNEIGLCRNNHLPINL